MSDAGLTGAELMAWNEASAAKWKALVSARPEVLAIPCDIYRPGTVSELLQHIVGAELRYAERLLDVPVTDYGAIPSRTAEEIFATHDRALEMFRGLLQDGAFDWKREIEFGTLTAGRLKAPRRAVFQHAMLHAVRHYAQLATLGRQHGFGVGPLDYLLMAARPVG
ncbi:MAG: DinB family protein [Acidobacteriota bacterium]|nr:DinB family protein [Acidobacteriota bacterium]